MNRRGRLGLLMVMVALFAQSMDIVLAGEIPPTNWLRFVSLIVGGALFVLSAGEAK